MSLTSVRLNALVRSGRATSSFSWDFVGTVASLTRPFLARAAIPFKGIVFVPWEESSVKESVMKNSVNAGVVPMLSMSTSTFSLQTTS